MIPTCPFVQRVLIACQVRGISNSTLPLEEIDLSSPPGEMLKINPSGSVPTIELKDGDGFHESLVINEFLDSLPAIGPRLYGSSPAENARMKVLVETATSKLLAPLQQAIYSWGNLNTVRKAQMPLTAGFEWLEKALEKSGGLYLGGAQLNAADVALAPFIVRLKWLYEKHPWCAKPAGKSRAENYISSITRCPEVIAGLPDEESLKTSTQRFLNPHPLLQAVIDAPRELIENPTSYLADNKEKLSAWTLERDDQGFCLSAKFTFKDHADALNKLNWLHDAQETSDHHTSLIVRDFQSIEITLVTHEPRWGVTRKDLAMASAIQAYFTEGRLP